MASLNLSTAERNTVRASWGDAMAAKQYKTEVVIHEMFTNLCRSSEDARDLFENASVRSAQEKLFAEMMSFTMMYLHNSSILDECMGEFVKENPQLVRCGVRYLEPMGGVMIQYLRATLGKSFHPGLETLWIKTYIYLANSILMSDESDVESVLSREGSGESDPSEVENEADPEEIAPLKVPARAPARDRALEKQEEKEPKEHSPFLAPAPAFKAAPLPRLNTPASPVAVDLQKEKYRGFRRSVGEAPTGFSQPIRFSQPEPQPRSALREVAEPVSPSTSDFEVRSKAPFDPRRATNHRRKSSEYGAGIEADAESARRSFSGSSCESPVSEVEDEFDLAPAVEEVRPRRPQFDSNSFGIKGLAPIAETDMDENDGDEESSQYSDEVDSDSNRKSSCDGQSSRTSSLSLGRSDYKSSVSSGSARGFSPDLMKPGAAAAPSAAFRSHAPTWSQSSDISYIAPLSSGTHGGSENALPMMHRNFGSTPSLTSRSLYSPGKRASAGFMRSSFVLKREMEEHNVHETHVPSLAHLQASRSTSSLPLVPPTPVFAAPEAAQPAAPMAAKSAAAKQAPASTPTKKKSGLRSRLGSLFGREKEVQTPPPAQKAPKSSAASVHSATSHYSAVKRPAKAPTPAKIEQRPRRGSVTSSAAPSIATSTPTIHTTSRISASEVRRQYRPEPTGYAASIYSKPSMVQENASIYSNETTVSGFSFFKNRSKTRYEEFEREKQKKNKYNVKKVPYRTVYVKDFIR